MVVTDGTGARVTTGRFAVAILGIVTLFALALAAIVALTIANRPTGTVLWLTGAIAVPVALGLLNYATIRQVRYDLHNGVQDSIAAKTADAVAETAAHVAAGLAAADPAPGAS